MSFDYSGRRVIVAGGGGAGMGAAGARLLASLGAEVFVLDLRQPAGRDSGEFLPTDLSDPDAIAAAVARVGGPLHGLFNCQGVSGVAPGSTAASVMRVNFLGVRCLTDAALPLIPPGGAVASIASAGGLGWPRRLEAIESLLATSGFEAGLAWLEAQPEDVVGPAFPNAYAFSKQALIVWTMRQAVSSIERGVRINCTSPGSVQTSMAADFPSEGVEAISRLVGRASAPDEQAWPLLFLNSKAASYVNGANLVVDGGYSAARTLRLLPQA